MISQSFLALKTTILDKVKNKGDGDEPTTVVNDIDRTNNHPNLPAAEKIPPGKEKEELIRIS